MKDTPEHVETLYREMLLGRSSEERFLMGCRMFDAARALVRASLADLAATDRSPELRVELFLRTYGQDFDPETRDRIAAQLGGSSWPNRSRKRS